MRFIIASFFTLLTTTLLAQPNQSNKRAIEVFQSLLDKLSSYETMSYRYERSVNYFSENYHSETNADVFLDFRGNDTALGFKFQVENNIYKSVYNGSESFYLNKEDSTIKVSFKAQIGHVQSLPTLTNSIITLKKALPKILSDENILKKLSDTTINSSSYYLASFVLHNISLNNLGDYFPISLKRDFLYKILIDRTTFLPLHVIQTNNAEPKDYTLTTFSNLKSDITQIPDNSWYYSTYLKDFKPSSEKKATLIDANAIAPDWQASYFNTNDSISMSKLKGQVVLIEFWIKNCGYCIAAVPELNNLIKKYKKYNLSVIGINKHDKQEDVNYFYQKNRPKFKSVFDTDGSITKAYGVDSFPTLILIDKKGIVLYAGGFDKELLDGLLKTALD